MPISFLADVLTLLGEILIAVAVIRVHRRVLKDHHIDKDVLKTIRGEQRYAVVGIVLLVIGFLLRLLS